MIHILIKKNLEAENYTFGNTIISINLAPYKEKHQEITTSILFNISYCISIRSYY